MEAIPVINSKNEFVNLSLDQQFFGLLKQQIQKDFDSAACYINLTACDNSSKLYKEIYQLTLGLFNSDFRKIVDLLYRIDVPEQKLKLHLDKKNDDSVNLITILILQRECQKVWYKNYWGKLDA